MMKDNNHKDIWLYISAQGIHLYDRGKLTSQFGPNVYEKFEWRHIQTLCYSKQYLCILPHSGFQSKTKLKKYKLKMDQKKWVHRFFYLSFCLFIEIYNQKLLNSYVIGKLWKEQCYKVLRFLLNPCHRFFERFEVYGILCNLCPNSPIKLNFENKC